MALKEGDTEQVMSSNYPVVNTLGWSVHVEAVCAQIQELLNVLWRLGGPGIINTNILFFGFTALRMTAAFDTALRPLTGT